MADLRMVHALGLEIPSRRLLERYSQMQTGSAVGNNEAGVYRALFRGGGGFNGVCDLGGNAHLGCPHGHNVFVVPDVTSDSDTENEDIDSEISTESGGSDAESDLSILSISIPSMKDARKTRVARQPLFLDLVLKNARKLMVPTVPTAKTMVMLTAKQL